MSMRVFVRIVDKGSLRAAATALELSPAMVGNHLQALEEHLGESLINRTTRRQNLTDFGHLYYARCTEILSLVTDAEALSSQARTKPPSGKLFVTAPISFGSEALVPALRDFCKQYPDIEIKLSLSDRNADLIEDEMDAAIRIGKLPDSNLISRKLCNYTMVACASALYLQQYGKPTTPQNLSKHHCIKFSATASTPWKFLTQGQLESIDVSGPLQINDGHALRRAAIEGMGVIMQPYILLAEDIRNGTLIPLLEHYTLAAREVHIIYLRHRNMPTKLRLFIDHLVDHFSG